MRDRPAPDTPGSPNGPSGPTAEDPGAPPPGGGRGRRHRVDRNVKLLGVNSLLTDISSESVNAVLPLYLRNVLGFSALGFGIFDGIYQGMSAILRIYGGTIADRRRRHKEVAGGGYALSAACKVGLLASTTAAPTAGVLFLDRMGKGIRTAPRDALISLSSDPENMGESFGVHRALDTIGALLGPILAFALLWFTPEAYDSVFVVSFCVAVLGLGVLFFFVQNPPKERLDAARARVLTQGAGLRELMANKGFRRIAVAGGLLSVVTVSDAFVYLVYQHRTDMSSTPFPLLFVGTALAYLLLAVPLGRLSDRIGRAPVFLGGHLLLIGCYAILRGSGQGFLTIAVILGLLGTYYAATDGVLMAMASGVIPDELRTSGLAWLTTVTVAARLVASIGFGLLWKWHGPDGALSFFLAGMVVAVPLAFLVLFRSSTRTEVPTP
ncbi:MAG TPA: MFS transporter [Acidimicrobiia bacterium]|nr:MFS transporter [Acidimicrobiia bacterium]